MTDVKRLLEQAGKNGITPPPWNYTDAINAAMYGEEDAFQWTPGNVDLAVYAVNHLPDYLAAVEALERLLDRYTMRPVQYREKYGIPTRSTIDAELDDEDTDREQVIAATRDAIVRLRDEVTA